MIGVKDLEKREEEESEISFRKILKMSTGQRLDFCSEISKEEKEDVLDILDAWIGEGREVLLKNPKDTSAVKNIKRMIEIRNDLENTNVNVRLSLEALVLSLSEG